MWALIPFIIAIGYAITDILLNRKIDDCYTVHFLRNALQGRSSSMKAFVPQLLSNSLTIIITPYIIRGLRL